jgi:hypothetical protein
LEAVEDFLQVEADESANSTVTTVTGPEAVNDETADEEEADNEAAVGEAANGEIFLVDEEAANREIFLVDEEAANGEIFLVDEEAADEAPFLNMPFPSKETPSVTAVINPPSPSPTLNSFEDEIIMIRSGVDLTRVE